MREPLRVLHTEIITRGDFNFCMQHPTAGQSEHTHQIWSPTHITLLIFKLKKQNEQKRYSGYIFVTLSWVTNCVGMAAQFVTWETNCVGVTNCITTYPKANHNKNEKEKAPPHLRKKEELTWTVSKSVYIRVSATGQPITVITIFSHEP